MRRYIVIGQNGPLLISHTLWSIVIPASTTYHIISSHVVRSQPERSPYPPLRVPFSSCFFCRYSISWLLLHASCLCQSLWQADKARLSNQHFCIHAAYQA